MYYAIITIIHVQLNIMSCKSNLLHLQIYEIYLNVNIVVYMVLTLTAC